MLQTWVLVVIGVLINLILGMLWYGPLFGKPWKKAIKMKKAPKMKAGDYFWMLVIAVIASFGTIILVNYSGVSDMIRGAFIGMVIGLTGSVIVIANGIIYEKKPISLLFINGLYYIIFFAVVGAIAAYY